MLLDSVTMRPVSCLSTGFTFVVILRYIKTCDLFVNGGYLCIYTPFTLGPVWLGGVHKTETRGPNRDFYKKAEYERIIEHKTKT